MFETLNDDNFTMFAIKHYNNPSCSGIDEFDEDILRIKYIKRLLRKFQVSQELRERLILNHIIVLYNVFDHSACTEMLIYKLKGYHEYLYPFLLLLNYVREEQINVVMSDDIIQQLRKI